MYLTMFNTNKPGQFKITYSYNDQDPENATEVLEDLFEIEEVFVKTEEADLTWVYILGGLGGGLILICFCYVCSKCMVAQQKHEEDLLKRD